MQLNPNIKYFKRRVSGDDIVPRPAKWGGSAIFYETSEEGFPIRQIQILSLVWFSPTMTGIITMIMVGVMAIRLEASHRPRLR